MSKVHATVCPVYTLSIAHIGYELYLVGNILRFLKREKNLLQILTGPRQVGKSSAAFQVGEKWRGEVRYASADTPIPPGAEWIRHQWQLARLVSGENPLLVQKGLAELLTGRFFLHRLGHWQFSQMSEAFGLGLEEWLYFGGYPGAVSFIESEDEWKAYVRDSLIETVLSKDVLQMQSIAKPALLRHLFMLSTAYPAHILSYNKMLGQLTDAGNTTTLSHYVQLLHSAFLLSGLELYKIGQRPKRGSSPKLVLWNNALVNAVSGKGFEASKNNPEEWGRLVDNAVGAALLNQLQGLPFELYYWRQKSSEVDYVLHTSESTWAIEVKSSRMKNPHGMRRFLELYPKAKPFIIGGSGMPLEEFFRTPLPEQLES